MVGWLVSWLVRCSWLAGWLIGQLVGLFLFLIFSADVMVEVTYYVPLTLYESFYKLLQNATMCYCNLRQLESLQIATMCYGNIQQAHQTQNTKL